MNSVFILFVTALCALALAQSTTELSCPPVISNTPSISLGGTCEGSVCVNDSTCATGQKCCASACSLDSRCRMAVNATELQRLCDMKQSQNMKSCVRYVVSSGQCVERNTDSHCNLTMSASSNSLTTSFTVVPGNCLNGQCVDPCVALNCDAQSTACSVSSCVHTDTGVSCQAKSVATMSSTNTVITIPCTTTDGSTGSCHDGSCVATVTPCTQACIEGMTCAANGQCVPRPGVTCSSTGTCTCDCSNLTPLLSRTCSDQSTVQPMCSGYLNDCKFVPATCPAPVCVAKKSSSCAFSYTCVDASITTTDLSTALSAAVCISSTDANDLVKRCVDAVVINRCQAISATNGLKVCNWNNDFNLTAIVQHCRNQVMELTPSPEMVVTPVPITGCSSVVDSCMRCLAISTEQCQFLPAGTYAEASTSVRLAPRCVSVSADLTNSLYSSASLLPIKDMTSCPIFTSSPMSEEVEKIGSVNETTLTSAITATVSTSTTVDDPCTQLSGYAVIVLGLSQATLDSIFNHIKLQMIVQFYSLTNVPVDQTKLTALCGCLKKTSTNLLGFQDAFWDKCELASTTLKRSMLQSSSSIYVFNFTSSPVNSSVSTAGSTSGMPMSTSGMDMSSSGMTMPMSSTGMSMSTGSASTSGMSMTTGMPMSGTSKSSDSQIMFPSAFMAFLGLVLACYCLLV